MPRRHLAGSGGHVFHVMNRAVHGTVLFERADDYAGFMRVLTEAGQRHVVDLLAYCLMPNHWHLVLRPAADRELSACMQWLTTTHAQRWRRVRGTSGRGAVYQGRFRWVPVQQDQHFLRLCLYVERNPLRARLATRAEHWRWSSAWQRRSQTRGEPQLADWPVERPAGWTELLNGEGQSDETDAIRRAVQRGRPYGSREWTVRTSALLDISDRDVGRPRRR